MSNEIVTCKSCANQFSGSYCNECGEKVIDQKDRTLKYFLGDFINAITFADNKLWRTLKAILVSPGKYSSDFVEGRRRGYMKPISIFFLANLIYFLVPLFNTFNSNLTIQTRAFIHSKVAEKMVSNEIEERGISYAEYQTKYDAKTTELSKILLIMMALFIALFFWPIHFGGKHSLIADHLTVGLELMTYIIIYCTLIVSFILHALSQFGTYLLTDKIVSTLNLILLIYFISQLEYSFYGFKGIRLAVNSFFGILSVVISLYLYRAFLFFVTFWSI